MQTTSKGYMSFNVERQPGTNQVILENVPEVNDIPDNAVFIARTAIQPTTWRVLSVRETAKNEFQVGALEHNPSKYDVYRGRAGVRGRRNVRFPNRRIGTPYFPW